MEKHIKGQDVNLFIDGSVVAASSGCSFSVNANSSDATAKDDAGGGMWDNPEFTYYDWSCSNESFVVNIETLITFLTKIIHGDGTVDVLAKVEGSFSATFGRKGKAIITSMEIDAPCDDFLKMTLSMEGASALTADTKMHAIAPNLLPKIKGKALMLAINTSKTATAEWHTLACSTSHKLSLSAQTSDTRDKDTNDLAPAKEVTGKSLTLSTENLIEAGNQEVTGVVMSNIFGYLTTGATVKIAVGYYPDSIGAALDLSNDWGASRNVIITGDFMVSSLELNGTNKEDATYSAEFQCKGAPFVGEE